MKNDDYKNETTLEGLLLNAGNRLEAAGVPDARIDAWLLMEHCFSITRSRYFLDRKKTILDNARVRKYAALINERAQRVPLQYLTGSQGFMGLDFKVNPAVLIPRQDTETLVEAVLDYSKKAKPQSVLDLCTGSGCIAVSLAHYGNFSRVEASDISEDALEIANANIHANSVNVKTLKSDLFCSIAGRYDVIVSNPPYIVQDVIGMLEPEVRDYEPHIALCGGNDGLQFYRHIAMEAGMHLNPGGALFVEIGYDQGNSVPKLFEEHGFEGVSVAKDLAGLDRVVWGRTGVCHV